MSKSDSGGIGAKKGFLYQDYVAALCTLKMLTDKSVNKIRCEVSDDIDIVFDDYIEYIQVKTTKADRSWLISEFTQVSSRKEKNVSGKEKKILNKDSILHKSLDCDEGDLPGHFRIVSPRDICSKLSYLKIPLSERNDSQCKEDILKSLRNALKDYKSPNGNDVEYWLDHAAWEVIAGDEQIKLEAFKIITTVAYEYCGIHLNPSRDPERILNDLLVNLIEKSASSIVLRSEDNKIYTRKDFIEWFKKEVIYYGEKSKDQLKVYTAEKAKLMVILDEFLTDDSRYAFDGEKACQGLQGLYHRKKYNYNNISRGIAQWLPEVLLRPSEIAEQSPEKLEEKIKRYAFRKEKYLSELESMIASVLLHSTIRTKYGSQPIPAHLYIDDGNCTFFENIHILLNDHEPDILLMGFSYIIADNVSDSLFQIVEDFDKLLESDAFSQKNEKILEDKEDGYLLKHDIDDILQANTSFDENLSRFRFAFFLGYETEVLKCNMNDMSSSYMSLLEQEVIFNFQKMIDALVAKDDFFKDLNMDVYLYPIPSIDNLKLAVKLQVEGG
ncbi:dsDNA nuclease domain-containing protein [Vreelandella sp. H-I2]